MFKNRRAELEKLKKDHAAGSIDVPTELEKIMYAEARECIKKQYDDLGGAMALERVGRRGSDKGFQELLTGLDKKIKLKALQKTWEFTRTGPLMLRFVETFFYILLSNTQQFLFVAMIYSMYQNAGLTSVFYPMAVFGFGMLEEVGPSRTFWDWVRWYTVGLVGCKFIVNAWPTISDWVSGSDSDGSDAGA